MKNIINIMVLGKWGIHHYPPQQATRWCILEKHSKYNGFEIVGWEPCCAVGWCIRPNTTNIFILAPSGHTPPSFMDLAWGGVYEGIQKNLAKSINTPSDP